MIDKLKSIKKEKAIEYMIIIGITLFLCQGFLQMHYSSDTYVLYDLGYMEYPEQYFLLDGRLISAIVCYTAGILKIPVEAYIIGMDFIGIIFVGTSIYIMERLLKNIINPKNKLIEILIIAGSFILILNQFTLEYLLFPESAVMCLGVLLNIVAIKLMIESPKHKYVKIFLALLTATIAYQGELNMFPILAIMTYIIKGIVDKREYKVKEKEFFIEMIKLAVIVLVVLAISMAVVKIGLKALDSSQDRMMHLINFRAVELRGETVQEYMIELWNQCMGMLPNHTNTIMLAVSFIMLIMLGTKKEYMFQYVLMILVSFIICILPMFIYNTGVCGRVNQPLMMMWGASILVILAQVSIVESGRRTKIVYAFVIISFIINSIYIMRNITEHIAANKVDENNGKTIKYAIERYEAETGIKVTKFSYCYDLEPQQYAVGIKPMQSLTERKLACSWCIRQAMNYYCERKFEMVKIPSKIYKEKISEKDYKEFSEEQLIFDNDAVYMVVY